MKFSPKQQKLIGIIEKTWPEYRITERLGAGQYGVVFLAVREDPGTGIRSEEAIKIIDLRSESDTDSAEQMALSLEEYYELKKQTELEEIRTLERLKGASHIIHISDYKVVESADLTSCYILIRMDAMTSLQKILREHEQDTQAQAERFAKKVGLDMCRALRHLQSAAGASTAHRDIKPDNILMSGNGDFYLADFGFARVLQSPGNLSYKGTQEYVAPEVGTGRYDHRVDIYSLGLVLYRILNHGRLPFAPAWPERITREDDARSDILLRTPGRTLPPPDNCSQAFSDIVCCMCAYDPEHRFRDAAAIENAILNLDRPKTVSNPQPAKDSHTGRRILIICAAAAVCLLAAVGIRSALQRKGNAETAAVAQSSAEAVITEIPAETAEGSSAGNAESRGSDETVRISLSSQTMTANEQAYVRQDVMNTLGMSFGDAVCIGSFGYKECFARYYVEDFAHLTGNLSCPDNASQDAAATLTIYTDDNESEPLFTTKVDRSMLLTGFDIDVSNAHFVTFRLVSDKDFAQVMITDAVLSDGAASPASAEAASASEAAAAEAPARAAADLTALTITANEQAYVRQDVMNTLGMTFGDAVCIGSFGYKECFARYYVEDFARLTGNLSCPDDASEDASATLTIYADDNENEPLFTVKVDRSMLLTGFDIDVSNAHFVTFRLVSDKDFAQVMITDARLQ